MNTSETQTPAIIIILGATGDLAAKKIFPSLWHLFKHDRLPPHFSVISVARRDLSVDEFRAIVKDAVLNHGGISDESSFEAFLARFEYHTALFEDADAFQSLALRITETERSWGICGNKLFYLAVPPSAYEEIFKNLAGARLNEPCGGESGWSRVLIEKPFGSDEKSAQKLQELLLAYFKEDQIYRIDHYLFKEIVQGIEHFRFSNNLFESTWDNTTIERIDIRLLEEIGIEDRGAFYDSVGTLRDVGQSHLLAMLAAITMDPQSRTVESIRESRADILGHIRPWSEEMIHANTFRAQHEGYQSIAGVTLNSKTETYFALKTELTHQRWRGVPITLEAGKSVGGARKEIVLTLKHPRVCLLCEAGAHGANTITFRLEPNDEILIHFWTKKPGFERELEERTFSFFLYEKETKMQYVEEYAKVLNAAFIGNQAQFVSNAEIDAMWRFVDPILDAWRRNSVPLASYPKGSKPEPIFLISAPDTDEKRRGSLGIIGLGKMGGSLARRLMEVGWHVVGFNAHREITDALVAEGLDGAFSIPELISKLPAPRLVWLMVPYAAVDDVLNELTPHLNPGDIIVDGGNSPYRESIRRKKELEGRGIEFLDIGVSGGPGGARTGACMMVGGQKEAYERLEDTGFFKDTCVSNGWAYLGESGSGHYAKMVHNGIEYGMMQSIAEGFDLLKHSKEFTFDLAQVADVYAHGSVIVSRLVSWLRDSYQSFGVDLTKISGRAASSGEGKWTIETGNRDGIKLPAIQAALDVRTASAENPSYQGRIISALRGAFGQHPVSRSGDEPKIL